MSSSRVLTREEIQGRIADGQLIVISHNQVLRLDKWLERHPGGRLPILHMVGRDATDQIAVSHSPKILQQMRGHSIGVIDQPWIDFEPPISGGKFCGGDIKDKAPGASPIIDLVEFEKSAVAIEEFHKEEAVDCDEKHEVCDEENIKSQRLTTNSPVVRTKYSEWAVAHSIASRTLQAQMAEHKAAFSREAFIYQAEQIEIDRDLSEYPSIDAETQHKISSRFRELHQTVTESGLYRCHFSNYARELVRYTSLFALFLVALKYEWFVTSAIFLGLFWHQIMFTAHDAGHRAITHNFTIDMMIGIFIADFCCGLSIGWWKSSHNVHHLVPNHPEHDPDIQNVPLYSTSISFLKSIRSTYYGSLFPWDAVADTLIPIQKYTYYPVMCLARFNLYFLSWLHLVSDKAARLPSSTWTRPLEIACMACFWYLFGYRLLVLSIPTWSLRVMFVFVSHIATLPLHIQITLSHWGMSTADLGATESFAQKQLRTTMDIDCPAWLDFFHGGLQFQAVHHLFPRLPRHNLREAQKLVRVFCDEVGIKYTIFGFVDGNEVMMGKLTEISKQLEIMVECQKHVALEITG